MIEKFKEFYRIEFNRIHILLLLGLLLYKLLIILGIPDLVIMVLCIVGIIGRFIWNCLKQFRI